jgi:hypothetical protein
LPSSSRADNVASEEGREKFLAGHENCFDALAVNSTREFENLSFEHAPRLSSREAKSKFRQLIFSPPRHDFT